MLMSDEDYKKKHKKKSVNYQAALKRAIHGGDFEGVIKNIMLMAVKNNTADDWKCSPRTFMELLQVLHKYRTEFGDADQMQDILSVLEGGKDD